MDPQKSYNFLLQPQFHIFYICPFVFTHWQNPVLHLCLLHASSVQKANEMVWCKPLRWLWIFRSVWISGVAWLSAQYCLCLGGASSFSPPGSFSSQRSTLVNLIWYLVKTNNHQLGETFDKSHLYLPRSLSHWILFGLFFTSDKHLCDWGKFIIIWQT